MKTLDKQTTTYEPNHTVKVVVTNTPVINEKTRETHYTRTVTVKVDAGFKLEPLRFKDAEAITDFIGSIDFDEPQTHLALESV